MRKWCGKMGTGKKGQTFINNFFTGMKNNEMIFFFAGNILYCVE